MSVIKWCSEVEAGLPLVDEGHRVLVAIINDVHDAMMRRASDLRFAELVARLRAYAGDYLEPEEHLLRFQGSAAAAAHLVQHEELRRELARLEGDVVAGHQILPIEMLGFLRGWLRQHRATAPDLSHEGARA